jgi:hypothetical protein
MASSAPRFGNIYAPPWVGFSPLLPGFCDTEFDNAVPNIPGTSIFVAHGGAIQIGTLQNSQQLFISSDADEVVREIQIIPLPPITAGAAVNPSDLRVRLRDGDGKLITSDFMYAVDLCGPLCPGLSLRRGTVVLIDLVNMNAAIDLNVQLIFKTVKRTACEPTAQPMVPAYCPLYRRYSKPRAGEEFHDSEYFFEFTTTGARDFFRIPLLVDNDADFLWRGLTGDLNVPSNTISPVGNVALTFYDPNGTQLVKVPTGGLLTPWNSPIAGMFRECLLSNGGGRPAPQWPEIRIPAGGGLDADLSFGAAATLRFSLRGVKVYQECRT